MCFGIGDTCTSAASKAGAGWGSLKSTVVSSTLLAWTGLPLTIKLLLKKLCCFSSKILLMVKTTSSAVSFSPSCQVRSFSVLVYKSACLLKESDCLLNKMSFCHCSPETMVRISPGLSSDLPDHPHSSDSAPPDQLVRQWSKFAAVFWLSVISCCGSCTGCIPIRLRRRSRIPAGACTYNQHQYNEYQYTSQITTHRSSPRVLLVCNKFIINRNSRIYNRSKTVYSPCH